MHLKCPTIWALERFSSLFPVIWYEFLCSSSRSSWDKAAVQRSRTPSRPKVGVKHHQCFIWSPSSCMFHVVVLCSRRFRDSWPDAAVPWTSTKAYATAGGIPFEHCRLAKSAAQQCWIRNHIAFSVFLQDYLDMVGLSVMFPRVEVFLIQGSPVDMLERPPMDGRRSIWSG